jgi:hypothetical protein
MPESGESRFWWLRRPQPQVPQKEADRRAGLALAALLDEAGRSEIEALAVRGDRIRAIRRIRELTGVRLLDSRRIFESLQG